MRNIFNAFVGKYWRVLGLKLNPEFQENLNSLRSLVLKNN